MAEFHFEFDASAEDRLRLDLLHLVSADHHRWPVEVRWREGGLTARTHACASGALYLPWEMSDGTEVVLHTTSLMAREEPYRLLVELARGQLNQARNQLADLEQSTGSAPADAAARLKEACRLLHRAISTNDIAESDGLAEQSLEASFHTGEALAITWGRMLAPPPAPLDALGRLGCVVDPAVGAVGAVVPPDGPDAIEPLREVFDGVSIPIRWNLLEPTQGRADWTRIDDLVARCEAAGLARCVGPIVDFRTGGLPEWILRWRHDVKMLATFLADMVESTIHRYLGKAAAWEVASAVNLAGELGLSDDQRMWLAARAVEAARAVDPEGAMVVGVSQPWGDYIGRSNGCGLSPLEFVDCLTRCEVEVHAIHLEVAMGYPQVGSFCRGLAEFQELLEQFRRVGTPLWVTLACPSSPAVGGVGAWGAGMSPDVQARFAEEFVAVALAQPGVTRVVWGQHADGEQALWPAAGLLDESNRPKPAHVRLAELRTSLTARS